MAYVLSIKKPITQSSQVDGQSTATNVVNEGKDPELLKMLQEDRIKVMERRNVALYNENIYLKNQVSQQLHRLEEFEQRLSIKTEKLSTGEIPIDLTNKIESRLDTSMSAFNCLPPMSLVCKLCRKKIEKDESKEPIVFITKSELESLEKDMQTLRDALVSREEAWDKIVEREQNYCRQLTRLAQEVMTANQVADNRQEDLQTMARTLEAKESELRSVLKEVSGLKKIVVKQENKYRSTERTNRHQTTNVQINERERRQINEIMQEMSSPKRKPKLNRSQKNSPRHSNN